MQKLFVLFLVVLLCFISFSLTKEIQEVQSAEPTSANLFGPSDGRGSCDYGVLSSGDAQTLDAADVMESTLEVDVPSLLEEDILEATNTF